MFDASEKSRLSDETGNYLFDDVLSGNVTLRQVVPTGWRQTYPGTAFYDGDLTVGSRNFGNTTTAVVRGVVYFDQDQDGTRDANESGMAGWRVFIDKDGDGLWNANEKSRITNSKGEWRFAGLAPGAYNIRIEQQQDFILTAPLTGVVNAKLVAGQSLSNRLFAEYREPETPE